MGHHGDASPEPVWTLGPISVKRTTDFLALVAFILSIVGLTAQARDYLRGARLALFAPDQILFLPSTKVPGVALQYNQPGMLATAIVSYVNDAPIGYNAVVARENMELEIAGQKYQYRAYEAIHSKLQGDNLDVDEQENVGPFAVNAGSAVSQEKLFLPYVATSWVAWSDFINKIGSSPIVAVTLTADVYGKDTLSVQCAVQFGPSEFREVNDPKRQWSAPLCQEKKAPLLDQRFRR
jgi:hypothetical protein